VCVCEVLISPLDIRLVKYKDLLAGDYPLIQLSYTPLTVAGDYALMQLIYI
jgi:hypothetical protein